MSLTTQLKLTNPKIRKMYEDSYDACQKHWSTGWKFSNKTEILNDAWVVNLTKNLKPKWWKMFFRTKAFKHLQNEIYELRGDVRALKEENANCKHRINCLETEVEVIKATTDRKEYYLQGLEFSYFLGVPKTSEELEKSGFKCVNILESPKARLWVKG